jgi:hypothetical protein
MAKRKGGRHKVPSPLVEHVSRFGNSYYARRKPQRRNQAAAPPRVMLWALVPEGLAHGIIRIAALECWSISRVVTEALADYFSGHYEYTPPADRAGKRRGR